ncbi:uncharacterized protein CCOS01_04390 [Colletotrichum costaricense]|uniref:Uncharacterized protein n=1 Tax=Colletotrichum costaricense TaxID=1209916 RepID=A0AAI9Z3X7_9PEZI|nr:uncharacterized protein CCOS01_04390 [Colletotrichum costaricense]KAK1532407.1 hypothetical protein CCOS01_04390 [Colletotrichum costaricense]
MFWSGQVEYAEQCIMGSGQLKLFVDGQGLAAIGALEDRRLNLTWGTLHVQTDVMLSSTHVRNSTVDTSGQVNFTVGSGQLCRPWSAEISEMYEYSSVPPPKCRVHTARLALDEIARVDLSSRGRWVISSTRAGRPECTLINETSL